MLFGDFAGQDIYGAGGMLREKDRDELLGPSPLYRLNKNCRNTPRVSALAGPLGGLAPDYTGILRPDDGIDPTWLYYHDAAHQQALLESTLAQLLQEGYRKHEIVILSPLADTHSAASILADGRSELARYQEDLTGRIRYCTIHAFKGLEAPVVVVTDISDVNASEQKSLLYVAITRSVGRLALCVSESERPRVAQAILDVLMRNGA